MKKNTTPLFITSIIIFALAAGFFGWQWKNSSDLNDQYATRVKDMEEELVELENMMKKNGLGELMEEDIKMSLNNLLEEYDGVKTNNRALNDSIDSQKEKIVFLLEELESSESSRKYTASELFKMKKEAETLRKVMKDYVHRVDSLNTLNLELQAKIKLKDEEIGVISEERDNLKEKTQDLASQVEIGGKLQILNLKSEAIKVRRSGSFVETSRARRADQVRSCFTIVANKIAEKGNKTFYLRVISPENKVLTSSASKTITVNGQSIETSISRTIDYQGKNVDLCIYYEKQMDRLPDGEYTTEIYTDGTKIGTTTFALK